jgi:hypothetical protein
MFIRGCSFLVISSAFWGVGHLDLWNELGHSLC